LFKPITENNANLKNYASHCMLVNMMAPFSKQESLANAKVRARQRCSSKTDFYMK